MFIIGYLVAVALLVLFIPGLFGSLFVMNIRDLHNTKNQVITSHYNKMNADASKLEPYSDSITNYYNEPDWRDEDIDWEDDYSS